MTTKKTERHYTRHNYKGLIQNLNAYCKIHILPRHKTKRQPAHMKQHSYCTYFKLQQTHTVDDLCNSLLTETREPKSGFASQSHSCLLANFPHALVTSLWMASVIMDDSNGQAWTAH